MANKKFFVDVDLQGNTINNLKADTLDITSNLASANTKRIVYWSGQYYYSNGTTWIALGNTGTLPTGGATGDILAKASGTDYDVEWISNYTSTVQHEVKLAESINIGQAVYVSSATGTNMLVSKASNASEATSSKTLGLLAFTGVTNDIGFVITEGLLAGLDTSTATAGDPVWLGTNGNLIFGLANKPVAPAHLVFIGIVTRVQSVNGEIFIKVQNGYELGELHNVDALNPNNNDGLFYNTSTSLWEHKSIATALGYTPENVANKSTDVSLGTSDTLYPTQNAVKVYTDNILGNSNALVYKGTIDCSTNPDYPAADAGWMYIASVAGKIGGASGTDVEVGDMIICNTDGTVSGNQATVGQYWNVIQKNIVGAVTGPSSSTNNTIPVFDGTTGKIIKEGIITDTGTNIGIGITSPTAKLHVSGNTIFGIGNDTSNYATTIVCSNDGINPKGLFVTRNSNAQGLHIHNQDGSQVNIDAIGFAVKPLNIRNRMAESLMFGTNDTERMRITSAGDVGIGTTTPSEKLEVSGNIKLLGTSSTKINIQSAAGVQTYLAADGAGSSFGSLTNHNVVFYRNNSEFARMTSTGFGIGTTTPAAKLDVNGTVKFNHNGATNYTVFQNDNEINTYTSAGVGGTVYIQYVTGAIANIGRNNLIVNSNTTGSSISGLTITSSANVGLGTATPSAKFHVRSTAIPSTSENIARFDVSDDTNSCLKIYNGTSTDASFVPTLEGSNSGTEVALALVGSGTTDTGNTAITIFDSRIGTAQAATRPLFQWNNYGSTQMSMRADGNLGIGITNPTYKLEVNGDVKVSTIANATTDTDKFLVSDSGVIKYRTGSEILSDIAAQGALTITNTGTSGAATLVGNTLNIPTYESSLIPKISGNEIWRGSTFRNNSTTIDTTSGITLSTTGTNTARSVGTTSYAARAIRLGVTATTASVGRYSGMRGSALLWYVTGGFLYTGEFNISDTAFVTGTHNFWGLASSTSDLVIGGSNNDQPSALTNIIAFANDSGDANLQIMYNDATGTATKTDLGSSFPSNRTVGAAVTTIYSCYLYNAPNSSDVIYRIVNKETGAVAQGTLSTNLPASTVGLNFFGARTMGTPLGGVNNSGQFDVYRLGVYSL